MMHLLHEAQLDRYFAGRLGPAAVARVLERVWRCSSCRTRYERHLVLERALPDGNNQRDDRLWRTILDSANARSQHPPVSRTGLASRRWFRWLAPVGASATVGLVLFVSQTHLSHSPALPVSRGGADETALAPTLHLFRTVAGRHSETVERTIRASDGILIAYSNPGIDLRYLMVFAVDARATVHWYYPAHEQPGDNPAATPIQTRALGIELGEEIRHPLATGALRLFALFLPRPLHVDQIERAVAAALAMHGGAVTGMAALPIREGQQVSRLLEVRE